jgi:hypothetical protein
MVKRIRIVDVKYKNPNGAWAKGTARGHGITKMEQKCIENITYRKNYLKSKRASSGLARRTKGAAKAAKLRATQISLGIAPDPTMGAKHLAQMRDINKARAKRGKASSKKRGRSVAPGPVMPGMKRLRRMVSVGGKKRGRDVVPGPVMPGMKRLRRMVSKRNFAGGVKPNAKRRRT